MIKRLFTQRFWHELFEAGVTLKAFNSVWETALGIFILSNPNHHITRHFDHLSLSMKSFIGAYLLFHGLLNIVLAYNLYKNRLWAYPFAIGTTSLFLVYQGYRLFHTHSLILLCVTIFDIAFMVLTWHEYKYQLHKRHAQHHTS